MIRTFGLNNPKKLLAYPDPRRDHIRGTIDAPVKLVEYGDFECTFCGEAYPVVQAVQRELGNNLCFAYRHFPITTVHLHAEHAAEAAEAAGAQGKFWEMYDLLFQNQDALEDEDLASYAEILGLDVDRLMAEILAGAYSGRIRQDFSSGIRSGVNGTPTFFINGIRHDGAWGLEEMLEALTRAAA